MKEIQILGEIYKIDETENLTNLNVLGLCDWTIKTIKLSSTLKIEENDGDLKNLKELENKVLRHEVIHAMMFESGNAECSCVHDEPTVDWIARMYPKMKRLFGELGIE